MINRFHPSFFKKGGFTLRHLNSHVVKNNISKDRQAYLNNVRAYKFKVKFAQISILILFLILWELLAYFKIIDSFITSKPSEILSTFIEMISEGLLLHIGVTCLETIIGFIFGAVIGTALASLLWWSPFFSQVLSPYLVILNSLPKVALGPIIIIWVGAGTSAIITMALAISLIVTIMEMLNGFTSTDENLIKMVKTLGANKVQTFCKIVFPANIPTLISAFKVNIGLCMVGVITGEFLVSKAGLGYLIVYGGQVFKLDLVMTSVIILAIVASLMYNSILFLAKIITPKNYI